MQHYVAIVHFYKSAFMRTLRLLALFFSVYWLYSNFTHGLSIKVPLFFLSLLIQIEVFYLFKITKVLPSVQVNENKDNNLYASTTLGVLEKVMTYRKTAAIVNALFRTPQGIFLLSKIPAGSKEIQLVDLPWDTVYANAATTAKSTQGRFITILDVLGGYLLLSEAQTKLLFNKKLKPEELLNLISWARHIFMNDEYPEKKRVTFFGNGLFESLTTGWTPETKKYTQDYSYMAYKQTPKNIGREKEFEAMLQALSKSENNNVLLIGDPGCGKENLVALFTMESFLHTSQVDMPHIRVLELMAGPLIAGAANRSELESRLQAIVEEVMHSGNIIMYIPELQNITGSSAYGIDLSGALLPYLKHGDIPIIASVSVGNFKSYIEKSPLVEIFTVIKLEEPDKPTAMKMLLQKAADIEEKNHVILTYKAIETAVDYADHYFQNAALPGSAIDVLEDVAHVVHLQRKKNTGLLSSDYGYVTEDDIINAIQAKTHIVISQPSAVEKDLLLHLEDKMHERVIDQQHAITVIADSMRRLRAGLESLKRPISFLFMGPTGVGKTETAKALAALYFGGEDKMIRLDMSEYADEEGIKRLLGAPPGEGEERGELTDKIADYPFSLVLLDEFEKAHPKILDLFLQVLEDGRLTDNKGKTVSFANSIVIATSNAGAEFIREEVMKGTAVDKTFSQRLLDYLQKQRLFRPELINRFDDVVIFKPLGQQEMEAIAKIMMQELTKRLAEQDITFSYDAGVMDKIIKEGFDIQFGARPLRRYIQDNIEDIIAKQKLEDKIKRGNKVFMSVGQDGNIALTINN